MKRHDRLVVGALAILLTLAIAPPVTAQQAGGFGVYEVGTPDMGLSAAGAGARAQDAATAYFNPAGMARLESNELMLGLFTGYMDRRFDVDWATTLGDGGGQAGGPLLGLGSNLVFGINDDIRLGLTINVPYIGTNDFDSDWVANITTTEESLMIFNIEPAVSYRITDKLSLGAGLNIYRALYTTKFFLGPIKADMDDADDWMLGFSLGALYEFSEATRVGLTYRSGANLKVEGGVDLPLPIEMSFSRAYDLPQSANLSVYHACTDKVAVLADVGWTEWSDFRYSLTTLGPLSIPLDRQWHKTWRAALGLQYQLSDRVMLSSGVSYDSSPLDASGRIPDIPPGETWRLSLGMQYDLTDNLTAGLSYTYADLGDGRSEVAHMPPLGLPLVTGEFDTNRAHFLGTTLSWRF